MDSRSPDARRTAPETYDTALAILFHMVEEGEITAEQALRRLQGMRARMQKSEERKDHQDSDQD
jgi:polyhydroxyalkanoate synthesis regulator phasin